MSRRHTIVMTAAISGLVSVGLVGLAQPAIATTSDLITAASLEPLSVAVATSTFPSGASTAVIAPVSPAVVAVQAAAFASSHDAPLILSASTTSAASSIAAMTTLGIDDVWLFGTDSSFSPAFVTAISGAATLTGSILDDTSLGRSSEALAATPGLDLILVARGDRAADLHLAGSEAARAGSAIVVLDGTETTTAVETAFAPYEDIEVLVLGDETTFPMLTLDEDQGEYLDLVRTADRDVVGLQLAERAIFSGAKGNMVVVAPSDQPVSGALAGMVAAARNGVVQVAGTTASLGSSSAAAGYLGLWRSGATSVTLVGTGLAPASLDTVAAPTLVAPAAAPAFRVTNVTVGATDHTITLTAAAGATQYAAYDPMGTLVATSGTPSLTIPGVPGILAVFADGPSGPVGHLEFRSNDYAAAAGREDAVIATIENGTAHLAFLGAYDTPRVIARVMTDPFAEVPVTAAPVVIGITCSHTFTDIGLDATKQWGYTVSSVSSEDQVSCDSGATAEPSTSTELLIAGVTLPPTEFPFFDSARGDSQSEDRVRVPTLTLAEAAIAGQGQAPGDRTTQRGPGDDWSDVLFRYQAFIPEQYLALPTEPTGDPLRPILAFGGDNHGHNVPWGSYRFQIDTTVKFGSDHNVTSTVAMGMTYMYKCTIFITSCIELEHQRQVNTQVGQSTSPHTATTADVNVWSKTYNPLSPLAPAIDMTMKYKLRTSGSALIGVHDKMPRHEIFFGLPFSEWVPIYQSGFHSLPCLYAVDASAPALDLVCRSRLNVQF